MCRNDVTAICRTPSLKLTFLANSQNLLFFLISEGRDDNWSTLFEELLPPKVGASPFFYSIFPFSFFLSLSFYFRCGNIFGIENIINGIITLFITDVKITIYLLKII